MASWAVALYGGLPTQSILSPAVLFWQGLWGPLRFYLHSRHVLWRLLWYVWCSPRAPSTGGTSHIGAPLQRFRPVPRPVVPHVPALFLALLTGPKISLISGRWSWGPRSIWVASTFRLASIFGCCSGTGAVLTLLRPVIPYTLALSVALSAGGVSGSGALQRFTLSTGCPPTTSSADGGSSSLKLWFPFIPEKKKNQKHKHNNHLIVTLESRHLRSITLV